MYRSMDPYIKTTVYEYCVLLLHWLAWLPQMKKTLGFTLGSGSFFIYLYLGFCVDFSCRQETCSLGWRETKLCEWNVCPINAFSSTNPFNARTYGCMLSGKEKRRSDVLLLWWRNKKFKKKYSLISKRKCTILSDVRLLVFFSHCSESLKLLECFLACRCVVIFCIRACSSWCGGRPTHCLWSWFGRKCTVGVHNHGQRGGWNIQPYQKR